MCPSLSNQFTFGLANQLAGRFVPATELEITRSRTSPFGDLVWHLMTQVNNGLLAAYITDFDPKRDKRRCFIPCLVYALAYLSIASNLVTLATISPRSECVCTHICSPFSKKPLLK